LKRTADLLRNGEAPEEVSDAFLPVQPQVSALRPEVADAVQAWLDAAGRGNAHPEEVHARRDRAADALDDFRRHAPASYWPDDKVHRVIETIRDAGAGGICVFCQEQLESFGKWEAVREAFAREVSRTGP
jgi:hypothetical protein